MTTGSRKLPKKAEDILLNGKWIETIEGSEFLLFDKYFLSTSKMSVRMIAFASHRTLSRMVDVKSLWATGHFLHVRKCSRKYTIGE